MPACNGLHGFAAAEYSCDEVTRLRSWMGLGDTAIAMTYRLVVNRKLAAVWDCVPSTGFVS